MTPMADATAPEIGTVTLVLITLLGGAWIIIQIVQALRGPQKPVDYVTQAEVAGIKSDLLLLRNDLSSVKADLEKKVDTKFSDQDKKIDALDNYSHSTAHKLNNDIQGVVNSVARLELTLVEKIHSEVKPVLDKLESMGKTLAVIRAIRTRDGNHNCAPGGCGVEDEPLDEK